MRVWALDLRFRVSEGLFSLHFLSPIVQKAESGRALSRIVVRPAGPDEMKGSIRAGGPERPSWDYV